MNRASKIALFVASVLFLIGGWMIAKSIEYKSVADEAVAQWSVRIDTLEDKQQELSDYCNYYIQEWRNMNGDNMPDSGNDFSDVPYVDTTYPYDGYPSGRVNDGSSGKYLGVPPEVVRELSENN